MTFSSHYSSLISQIEDEITQFLDQKSEQNTNPLLDDFYHLVRNNVMAGGKRLRPIMMIMAYRCYADDDRIIPPSISPELVHASSLILDDAMDEDVMRHGKPTFNAIYADKFLETMDFDLDHYEKGRNWVQRDSLKKLFFAQRAISRYSYTLSVLGSNVMYAMSLEALTRGTFDERSTLKALDLHRRMYQKLNEGQLLDILYESRHANEDEYLAMVFKKTGILFVYPLRIGLTFADAEDDKLLDAYASSMAKAFQIHDDILGTFGSETVTGKPSYSDIIEGKRTLLVIKAMENANDHQHKRLENILGYEHASREAVEEVRDIFVDTGAYDYCMGLARAYVRESKDMLPTDISSKAHSFFDTLADFVISRDH